MHNKTQHNETQYNDTQHNGLNGKICLNAISLTTHKNDTQHNNTNCDCQYSATQHKRHSIRKLTIEIKPFMSSVIIPNVVLLNVGAPLIDLGSIL
jgi:hypothetical protein